MGRNTGYFCLDTFCYQHSFLCLFHVDDKAYHTYQLQVEKHFKVLDRVGMKVAVMYGQR